MLEFIVCRNYTRARRFPKVVGVIGGWVSPWPLTPTQIGAIVVTGLVLIKTHAYWGFMLPSFLQLLVMAGGPVAAAWAVRHLRIEGRTPVQALQGTCNYVMRPRGGRVRGLSYRQPRPVHHGGRIFILEST